MVNKRHITAFVFARGGSKQIPKKNLVELNGKPLLRHSIDLAKALDGVSDVVVSTDCEEISTYARKIGASVPFRRPAELAGDKSSEFEAWKHAVSYYQRRGPPLDVFLSLPTTSPLRSIEDVEFCIEMFHCFKPDVLVTVTKSARNPAFNIVKKNKAGFMELTISGDHKTRQLAPDCFDLTTVAYLSSPKFILENNKIFDGNVIAV
jgi:N,N'-diacetyl-8-epilegionaminate cytidylyltransferase